MKTTKRQRGSAAAEILVTLALLACVFMFAGAMGAFSCHSRWSDSGYKVSYGLFKGCRIELPDGRKVPASSVKEIN